MTKAELEAKLAEADKATQAAHVKNVALQRERDVARQDARDAESELAEREDAMRNLHVWNAHAASGTPLCISGDEEIDLPSFALEVYTSNGSIIGVRVTKQEAGGGVAAAAGLIPADAS
jgi:hypothetical protein